MLDVALDYYSQNKEYTGALIDGLIEASFGDGHTLVYFEGNTERKKGTTMKRLLVSLTAVLAAVVFVGSPARSAEKDDCHYTDSAGQAQNACLPFVPVPLRLCDGKPILWGAHCEGVVTVTSKTVKVEDKDHHKKKHVKKDDRHDRKDVKRDHDERHDVKKDGDDRGDRGKYGKNEGDDRGDRGKYGKNEGDDRHDRKDVKHDYDERHDVKKDGDDRGDRGKYGKKEGPKYSNKDEHGKIRFGKDERKPFKFDRHFPGKELHGKHFVKQFRPHIKPHIVGHIKPDFVHFKPNFVGHVRPGIGHFNFKGGLKFHHGGKTQVTSSSRSGSSGSAAMQYAGGVIACMGTSLIIDGVIVHFTEDRELSHGEAYAAVGNCLIPFLGGFIGHALGDGINPCKTPDVISYTPGPGSVKSAGELKQDYLKKYCSKKR